MSDSDYTPKPIATEGIELSKDLIALREQLAEHLHDVWAIGRMNEGWTYGSKRDDDDRKHPCLVRYADLPDSEKQYDREAAVGTLKAILALGYRVEI